MQVCTSRLLVSTVSHSTSSQALTLTNSILILTSRTASSNLQIKTPVACYFWAKMRQ